MPVLLQINTIVNSGSTGRIAEEIGRLAISMGWDSYIAYGRNEKSSQSKLIKIGTKFDVYNHVMQTRFLDNHGLASIHATKSFLSEIDKINPSIVHLHNIHGYYLNYKILFNYLSKKNIPIIWTLHDCWSYTGHCAHYTSAQCNLWEDTCFSCPQKKDYPASIFYDGSKRNFKCKKESFTSVKDMTLIPVSKWLFNEVNRSFLNQYSQHIIHNGVDTRVFIPCQSNKEKWGVKNKFLILGVASTWDQRKGLNDFIKLSKFLNEDEVIILVGLKRKQILNLPPNVIGIQRTENLQQLAGLYSSADLYVNFSIEETFGMTTAESLSCGTPVIVYNSTACPEVISKNTGFVVEPHDIEAARKAIDQVKLIGKKKFQENCRERVLRNFNKETQWMNYINLYHYCPIKI